MSPVREVQRAQARRDAALLGVRRITWWVGAGAVALTAAASYVAAETFPGRTAGASPAAAAAPSATPITDPASGDSGGVPSDGGSSVPVQPSNNAPVAVSGGS